MNVVLALHPVVDGCLIACARCLDVVQHVLNRGDATASSAYAAIGPHLRHSLDHIVCFMRGLETGCIDYDARDRNAGVESDPEVFRGALEAVMAKLNTLDESALRKPIRVAQLAAPDQAPIVVESTLEREVLFLASHTIHHLAIVALIAREHGVEIPERLCVAYSTAAYRDKLAAQG